MHIENSDKPVTYYNLDIIISRWLSSKITTSYSIHIWATQRLKRISNQRFAIDRNRLENIGGGSTEKNY